jgi:hypothetical protein
MIQMSTQTHETNTADAINHLVDKASSGLDQISHALASHAPQAWLLVVKGAYAVGMSSLIVGAVFFLLALLFVSSSVFFAFAANKNFVRETDGFVGGMCVGAAVICFLIFIGCFIGTLSNLGDADSWARVVSPEGYVAQQVLTGALK